MNRYRRQNFCRLAVCVVAILGTAGILDTGGSSWVLAQAPSQGPNGSGGTGGPGGLGGQGGPPPNGPTTTNTHYSAAIYIRDGAYTPKDSTPSAVSGGTIGNTAASGFTIRSDREDFNGVLVRGDSSTYTVSHATIVLHGDGSNDFVGLGAGAMAEGGATLILRNVNITTSGLIRSAAVATGHSTLKVYDSTLLANGGALPRGYTFRGGPGMKTPPPGLHIGGTARTALTMDNSRSYFYRSTIVSNGWAGLSTDSANGYVYLEADHSTIRVLGPGYGLYADNGCHVVANHTRIDTRTYSAIMAGVSDLTLNDVTVRSARNSVMIHNVMGRPSESATLNIHGGTFITGQAAILVRSANAAIRIDGATFKSHNGILIQSVVSDDPNATKVNGQPTPGINIALKDARLDGNILHQDPDRTMSLTLADTVLEGAIGNASLALDSASRWIATADSRVTLVGSTGVSNLDAAPGVTISATAGAGTTLSGSYRLRSGGVLKVGTAG